MAAASKVVTFFDFFSVVDNAFPYYITFGILSFVYYQYVQSIDRMNNTLAKSMLTMFNSTYVVALHILNTMVPFL